MKKLLLLALLIFPTLLFAGGPDNFHFKVKGTIKAFDAKFVQLISSVDQKILWIPRSTVVGEIRSGSKVTALIAPSDIVKNQDELAKLNRAPARAK